MTERINPTDYYTKPLETWTVRELTDALGREEASKLLGITRNNLRQLFNKRRRTNMARMLVMQEAIRADEPTYRNKLVTLYTTGACHARSRA